MSVVHQPSSEIFAAFDKVIPLGLDKHVASRTVQLNWRNIFYCPWLRSSRHSARSLCTFRYIYIYIYIRHSHIITPTHIAGNSDGQGNHYVRRCGQDDDEPLCHAELSLPTTAQSRRLCSLFDADRKRWGPREDSSRVGEVGTPALWLMYLKKVLDKMCLWCVTQWIIFHAQTTLLCMCSWCVT